MIKLELDIDFCKNIDDSISEELRNLINKNDEEEIEVRPCLLLIPDNLSLLVYASEKGDRTILTYGTECVYATQSLEQVKKMINEQS